MDLKERLEEIESYFAVSSEDLRAIAFAFKKAMEDGISGRRSSLKMLPSYISRPTGTEKGSVVAVDFGGTNVRILQADLDGKGNFAINKMNRFPLKDVAGKYDYTSKDATGEQLFDYIAEHISEIATPGVENSLGQTFSFPCQQKGINSAELIHWTKEIRTSGVEGKDICEILKSSLDRKNVSHVKAKALINDTVGTLLAAAYTNQDVDIASICGTGHNTCYLEPNHPLTGLPMIVNMESGNFDGVTQNIFDDALDSESEMPGTQKLEKMVSGHYLGDIMRRVLLNLSEDGFLPDCAQLSRKGSVETADLSMMNADSMELVATSEFCKKIAMNDVSFSQLSAIKQIADLIAERSARLVAATFAGTVIHIDSAIEHKHIVAIDGSLYEKMPNYDLFIQKALDEIFPHRAGVVSTILAKDGSGIGAAIAAATVTD